MTNESDTPPDESRDVPDDWVRSQWRDLEEMRIRGQIRVDQMITGGAAGALVLSVTFVDRLGAPTTAGQMYLLGAAWAVLLVTLAASLYASRTQIRASEQAKANLTDMWEAGEYRAGWEKSRWDRRTTWLNHICFGGLLLGILMLAVYTWCNLWTKGVGQ